MQDEYQAGFSDVCVHYGISALDQSAAETVARSWQRLEPWPDVRAGMAGLRGKAITATLSNTDMSTAIALFKELGLGDGPVSPFWP
ncbi:MAG: hypothetical protein AB7G47_14635 [Mycolicibacterium sp.]|uniref:hypothetical protein n=1 Tax=Mycolicibacterium sp. TaxID=2320850 RepID=UPI003D12591F